MVWVLATAFIVYGTMLPFEPAADGSVVWANLSRIPLNPFISPDTGDWIALPDLLQNLLLFLPFGLGAALSLQAGERTSTGRVVGLALALSATLEALQLFTTSRVSTPADVLLNTAGAWVGALAAPAVLAVGMRVLQAPRTTRWVRQPAAWPACLAVVLLAAAALLPLDVTIDPWFVGWKARLWWMAPWQLAGVRSEPLALVRAAISALLWARWAGQAGEPRPGLHAVLVIGCLVLALELAQFGIESRMPGVGGLVAGWLGVVAGAGLAESRLSSVAWRRVGLVCAWAAMAWLASTAAQCDLREWTLTGAVLGGLLAADRRPGWQTLGLVAVACGGMLGVLLLWQASRAAVPFDGLSLLVGTLGAAAGAWALTIGRQRAQRVDGCWTSLEPMAR